ALVAHAVIGEVGGSHALRLEDDLERVPGRRHGDLRESRPLDQQRRVGRQTLEGKFSLGVRQVLDTAGDDRRALDRCAARVKDLTTDHLWPGGPRRLRLGALGGTAGQLVEGVRTRRWIGSGQCRCAGEAGGGEQAVPDQNRNDEKPERVSAVQDMSTTRRRWRCTHGYFRQYPEQECAQRKSFCGY